MVSKELFAVLMAGGAIFLAPYLIKKAGHKDFSKIVDHSYSIGHIAIKKMVGIHHTIRLVNAAKNALSSSLDVMKKKHSTKIRRSKSEKNFY